MPRLCDQSPLNLGVWDVQIVLQQGLKPSSEPTHIPVVPAVHSYSSETTRKTVAKQQCFVSYALANKDRHFCNIIVFTVKWLHTVLACWVSATDLQQLVVNAIDEVALPWVELQIPGDMVDSRLLHQVGWMLLLLFMRVSNLAPVLSSTDREFAVKATKLYPSCHLPFFPLARLVQVLLCAPGLTDILKMYCWDDPGPRTYCDSSNSAACRFSYSWAVTPVIHDSTPRQGAEGTIVTVVGRGFEDVAAVWLAASCGRTNCSITQKTGTAISCTVPAMPAGVYKVSAWVEASPLPASSNG